MRLETEQVVDLERSRHGWRCAALAGWSLALLGLACGASESHEQVGTLVVSDELRVGADDARGRITGTPSQLVRVDTSGRKLVLPPTGVQAFDPQGHAVAGLTPLPGASPDAGR